MPLYAGMTVNERRVISGWVTDWDQTVSKRDCARMMETLVAA
jgi:hypothetical protein